MKKMLLITALSLAGFAAPAFAQFDEGRFYFHFKIMDTSYDDPSNGFVQRLANDFAIDNITNIQFDEPDFGFRVTEGLILSRYFGVEAGLTYFGEPDVLVTQANGNVVRVSHQYFGGEVLAVGQYPVLPYLTVFGRAGAAYWRGEIDLETPLAGGLLETHSTGVDFTGGIGVRSLVGQVSLELAYDQTTVDDMDVSGLTFGIGFRY